MHCFAEGDYVAVNWNERWVRGYIEKLDPSGEKNIVRLVDHGGYWVLNNSQFKPLMMDYLSSLPFQAIEIFIAYIQPKNGNYTLMLCWFFLDCKLFFLYYISS